MLSGTPAKAEGVCSLSVGQGIAWTSRFPRCAAPRHSHTLSAWSSEFEACRAELPAGNTKRNWAFKNEKNILRGCG